MTARTRRILLSCLTLTVCMGLCLSLLSLAAALGILWG